jgi:ATP-binding cassette subfamily B protein
MDRIIVLHKGQLRESGTHQELLAARGIYHRLYQLQFQSSGSERPATSTA